MGALSKKLRSAQGGGILFWCPGCDGAHRVQVGEGPGPRWGYNSNPEAPTFSPSVLVTGHQLVMENGRWTGEWVRDAAGKPVLSICHSFVVDGRIQFLGDCTHALAGQTVDLPDFDGD
ncbi:ammonia monooxygenase [Rhizobium altiplani]|uniref:Ammonia monooxygenase n=1 Tax=Rhizobium altiplani TaxID=1864509 RepID=A0A109J4E3_9HYPH|nr:DUF6527 family protein [Rhizobium altiplani]KWV42145.1 ammonia monooxygenase [Rhizobium altiplani]